MTKLRLNILPGEIEKMKPASEADRSMAEPAVDEDGSNTESAVDEEKEEGSKTDQSNHAALRKSIGRSKP